MRDRRRTRRASCIALGACLVGACAQAPPAHDAAPGIEYIASPVTAGLGLPFTDVVRAGDVLYLSGVIGIRPGTLELVPGGLEPEARQALDNVRTMLEAAGASLDDVVRCLVMMDDMSQWSRFNAIYVEYFGDRRPARSALGTDGLALGAAVEIECTAVAPRHD